MTSEEWIALDRYVAGEGSADEREAMRLRIQANPNLAAIVEVMRSSRPAPNAAEAWSNVSARLGFDATTQRERSRAPLALMSSPARHDRATVRWVGLAAASLIVASASLLSWHALRPTVHNAPAIRAEYRTARGERATVELRDGTHVTLAPETELRVAAVGRQVYLKGEAVFSVTHDLTHPFRVVAPNGAIVQDVGTEFDLRAYDRTLRVVVTQGSVALRGTAQPVMLASGSVATIDSVGATQVVRDVAVDRYLAWTTGQLTFTNARMAEVIPELDRWLDVDLRLGSSSLADARLTLTLSDDPADVTIDIIARALNARVVQTGHSVTLYPNTSREGVRE